MKSMSQVSSCMNEMFNEMAQELEDTKEAHSRKEGYVSRLEDYFDRQLDGFEYIKDAL